MPVIVKLDAKASSPVIVMNEFIVCVASTKVRLLAPKESSACVVTIALALVVLPGPEPVKAVTPVSPTFPQRQLPRAQGSADPSGMHFDRSFRLVSALAPI